MIEPIACPKYTIDPRLANALPSIPKSYYILDEHTVSIPISNIIMRLAAN